jgi:hypothetical protein
MKPVYHVTTLPAIQNNTVVVYVINFYNEFYNGNFMSTDKKTCDEFTSEKAPSRLGQNAKDI